MIQLIATGMVYLECPRMQNRTRAFKICKQRGSQLKKNFLASLYNTAYVICSQLWLNEIGSASCLIICRWAKAVEVTLN